jgi:dynein heavy chain 1, cytosolic
LLEELNNSGMFENLIDDIKNDSIKWNELLDHPVAEMNVPEPWMAGDDPSLTNENVRLLKQTILIKVLRPDRFVSSALILTTKVMSEEALGHGQVDLEEITKQTKAKNPLCLVSAPGFDASTRVEALAKQINKKYKAVAIGSPEAFDQANDIITKAGKSGDWVLLKNVHLAPQWLVELEKTIYKMTLSPDFRLFLTMENNPKVPSTLLRSSTVLVFEPPSGIRASMERTFKQTINPDRTNKPPVERSRMHFIVSWFNAVVHERLRYTPIGWSKVYPFNEAD